MTQTAQDTRTLVFERNLPQPPEKVWRALTEAGLIEQWLMKNDFKATKGHKFQFRVETPYSLVVESEVLTATPHQELSYRWDSNGLESIVTWTLTPTAGGTHLRMEQSGFKADPSHDQFYEGAKYGWVGFLDGLERVAATVA
jgi:uncharacterized protein YndB with AHSA1/START domain